MAYFSANLTLATIVFLISQGAIISGQTPDGAAVNNQQQNEVDPFIYYGPHGYNTWVHSRCQEVPTVNVSLAEVLGTRGLLGPP